MPRHHQGSVLTPPPRGRSRGDVGIVLTVVLGTMLVPLNSTMIAVAVPELIDAFDASLGSVGWLVTGYLIAMASLQPVGGNLGDRFGRRPVLLGGLAWFAVASLGAALAPDLPLLIVFRIQQAVAGALVFPNGLALLREIAPPGRLGRRLGLIMGALPLAAAVGPLLAGVLLAVGDWRAIFLVNLVLVVPPLVLGVRYLPRSRPAGIQGRFDIAGASLLAVFLVAAAWTLNRGVTRSDGIFALAVATAAGMLFALQELRHPRPVVELRLFRNPQFVAANVGVALSNLAMYVTLFALPLVLARRGGWTGAQIGLVLATMTLTTTMFASSPLGGRAADRLGARLPATAGLALMTGCLVPLAFAGPELSGGAIIAALVGVGSGLGLATVPLQVAALEAVDVSRSGSVSGMFSTSRYLGSIAGISLLAGALQPVAGGGGGFRALFTVVAAAAAASAAAAFLLPGRADGTVDDRAEATR
ncbi:MAG TPA: MFS transporter [Gaiellaceae bacterium]|nr:MFS transporter [Gaiellaceae bacterium]